MYSALLAKFCNQIVQYFKHFPVTVLKNSVHRSNFPLLMNFCSLLFFGIVCTTEQIFLNLCGKTTWRFTISKVYHKYLRFPLGFVEPRARTILLIVLKVSMLNFQIGFSNTVIFFGKVSGKVG